MNDQDDHLWNGNLPESDQAYEKKLEEWQARDWPEWLAKHLKFPFTVRRTEDDDDAYFSPGADKAPFRLGPKMVVLQLAEEDVDRGMIIEVKEKEQIGYAPLADLEVTPKKDPNFWPVREYVVWFANRY